MAFLGMLPDAQTLKAKLANTLGGALSHRTPLAAQLLAARSPKKNSLLEALSSQGEQRQSQPQMGQAGSEVASFRQNQLPEKEELEEPETDKELQSYLEKADAGLTPAQRAKRESERFSKGLPIYLKADETYQSLGKNKNRLDVLDSLVKSKKLPTGFGRFNVDDEGNLRLPFLASPEAQRFVKTISEFAAGAKDTYGSRVTNFDLAQYLRQFPSLLNSQDGMKQVLSQLRIVNDINSVYHKNLKDVYEKAGGVRKIDPDIASSLARRKSEKKVEKLVKRFERIGTEESLPSAHKNKGERFYDDETGETFVSDGKSWVKEG